MSAALRRVDRSAKIVHVEAMPDPSPETNIELCLRAQDCHLIDQAAELVGTSRAHFIIAAAINESETLLQSTVFEVDADTLQEILVSLGTSPSADEAAGLFRLARCRPPWPRET